jgi:hypothetical protein
MLQRPYGQRGTCGRARSRLEETPAVHLPAEPRLFHVAIRLVVGARLLHPRHRIGVNNDLRWRNAKRRRFPI